MRLSAEQVRDILAALNRGGELAPGDHRRAPRMKLMAGADMSLQDESSRREQRLAVQVRNLSSRGLCVITDRAVAPGTQFIIHFPNRHGSETDILCTAMHCRPAYGRLFSVGAEFVCSITHTLGAADAEAELKRIRSSILS